MLKKLNNSQLLIFSFLIGGISVLGFAPFYLYPLPALNLAILVIFFERCKNFTSSFLVGLFFGLGLFITGTSWIFVSLYKFGGMNFFLAGTVVLLFSLYLSLYTGFVGLAFQYFKKINRVFLLLLVFPAIWTLAEVGRGYILTGFPWLSFGYSQVPLSPLSGFGPITGVYGLSFFLALLAGALNLILKDSYHPKIGKYAPKSILIIFCILASGHALKLIEWSYPVQKTSTTVALIQGNVAQNLKWEPRLAIQTLENYLKLALTTKADLLLLPETAFPVFHENLPKEFLERFEEPVKERGADILVGIPEIDPQNKKFNSVFSLGSSPSQTYRKIHLVPFGDYFPFQKLFGWFIKSAKIPMSSFSHGSLNQPVIEVAGQKIGVNICYEDVFGEEIIRHLPQATVLANFTNDAWWGKSLASKQHLQISQMRSLETSRVMLRATNTGVTAIIDWRGKVRAVLPEFESKILEGTIIGRQGTTPFVFLGNSPVFIISISIIVVGAQIRSKRNKIIRP